ncbi:MAG TPA: PQQ-dependent sugar dehydrogenase [Burkholderiales bacterium]|nr:PQQ-dependent sugar dehydrogenase [Burkholderiales bacterium]
MRTQLGPWLAASAFTLLAAAPLARSQVPVAPVQTQEQAIRVATVVKGLEHPWGMAFLPDGRMLVTERPGRLRMVQDGKLLPQPVAGLPALREHGQGGLLDVALHPRFAENGWIYLSYAGRGDGGYGTEVLRARLAADRLEDVKVIFRQEPRLSGGRHFGSRLVFDRQGYLYVTMGDRGEEERAQRLDQLQGKVVRLKDDGGIPADNPFVGRAGARPEIFTYGNRNIQGAAVNPATGLLWAHEHGPQGGDEINVLRPGVNYGWPVITYGVQYVIGTKIGEGTHKEGMAQPVWKWVPSIAPAGMAFYTGDRFPKWKGDLFVGALKDQMLVRLRLDGEKVVSEERMLKGIGRVRDVRAGPDGYLYLLLDAPDGSLLRVEPAR